MVSGSMVNAYKIPDEAIRIRVIANSNSDYDQKMKMKVKNDLEADMYNLLKNVKGVDKARKTINAHLDDIDKKIQDTINRNNYNISYNVNFGYNYFPPKEYKGIKYDEGYYESLVVTLGEGLGDNWWCVLFPPLCMIEAEDATDVEYTSIVKEILSKYSK